ncbi:NADH-quinone oxidoreductase subunit L [Escherichia coli]|uniref:NADH-quinone oxidoreductase subunit L n=1 Tax=Escherichia coli TaxID=562 RepID=A0A376LB24_ECOLX|nr:NADH-quinone oxidoreductase subunit L [Escherichia coli]
MVAVVGILLAAWLWLGKRTLVTSIANSAPGPSAGHLVVQRLGALTGCTTKCSSSRSWVLPGLLKRDPLNSMMNIPAVLSRFAGKRSAVKRERLSALVCGIHEHRCGRGAGTVDGTALS